MNSIKIKTKSLFFYLSFILFIFVFIGSFVIQKHNSEIDLNILHTENYIHNSINYLVNEKKEIYLKSSNIIFNDEKVINALENRNRELFYKLTKPYFDINKQRDENFWGLHVIFPDNLSFIRVHTPETPDKIIKRGTKPLIDSVNDTHKKIVGFDAGKFGYFLRVVTPIFSKNKKYLGVAEFSIKIDSLTHSIKNGFGYESVFLVKNIQNKKFLNNLPTTKDNLTLFQSTSKNLYSHFVNKNSNIINNLTIKNNIYGTTSIILSDTATIVVAFDITKQIQGKKIFENYIYTLNAIIAIVFSIVWFISTRMYIKGKKQVRSKINRFYNIISENVIYSITDLKGNITEVSDAFCEISKYNRNQLIGAPHSIVRHPDMDKSTYRDLWKTIKQNGIWSGDLINLSKNGESYWTKVTISPRYDENNKKIGYLSIKQNITDKKNIEKLSITDSLCGIYNRRHFDNQLTNVINTAKRKNETICLLILDVDFFKQYNDAYGHQMGDEVLKSIAKCLKDSIHRGDDYCFRLGGEEFAIIYKAKNKQNALVFAETIRTNIEDLKIIHKKSDINKYVTASFGVICKKATNVKNSDEIYKETDELLYKAKLYGRNQVVIN